MSNGMRVQIPPPALSPRHFKMQIAEYRLQIGRSCAGAALALSGGPRIAMKRALILLLDGVGIGELPDAARYGDVGSDSLGNTARAVGG